MNFLKRIFLLAGFITAALAAEKQGGPKDKPFLLDGFEKKVQLIISDIDGTLTADETEDCVAENVAGFALARKLGIPVGVATGRSLRRTISFLTDTDLNLVIYIGFPSAFYNGCFVVGKDGEILKDSTFSPEVIEEIINMVEAEGLLSHLQLCRFETCLSREDFEIERHSVKGVYQVRLFVEGEHRSTFRQKLEERFGSIMGYSLSADSCIELAPADCDKGQAVELMANSMGVPLENVLVLGNAENDIPMFTVAGRAVAVADASKEALEAAHAVAPRSGEGAFKAIVEDIERRGLYPDPTAGI